MKTKFASTNRIWLIEPSHFCSVLNTEQELKFLPPLVKIYGENLVYI